MSMSHKAYAFDWQAFEQDELLGILLEALQTNQTSLLIDYIEAHRNLLKDPYEGESIDEDWQTMIENQDVHEYGDFALTRFYDPTQDFGIAEAWLEVDEQLAEAQRNALLGFAIAHENQAFDPGRMGSYFQTPEQVTRSLVALSNVELPEIQDFRELLETSQQNKLGIYVTF